MSLLPSQYRNPTVLHVNITDSGGGVGRAAYRLHRGLIEEGINSLMFVDVKKTDDPTVIGPDNWLDKWYVRLRTRADKLPGVFSKKDHWAYASFNYLPYKRISEIWKIIDPDIVHLHWIGDGLFPLRLLPHLKMPVVSTLHGRWLFNGAQHLHNDKSRRFIDGFHKGNQDSLDGGLDVDRWVWNQKKKYLSDLDLNVVTLSRWMEQDAKKSMLLKEFPVTRIPNGLDPDLFHPKDKIEVRRKMNLSVSAKYIVYGANFATKDRNKGFDDFVAAIKILEQKEQQFEILIFGSNKPEESLPFKSKAHFWGYVKDEARLNEIYSAGDCFVLPSKQDNLPFTVMESLASGTPCVAYDVGGVSDMVDDGVNGFLATPEDPSSLAEKIQRILDLTEEKMCMMRVESRQKIEVEFSSKLQISNMISLYESILARSTH